MDFQLIKKNAETIKAMQQFHDTQQGEVIFSMSVDKAGQVIPCGLSEVPPEKMKALLMQMVIQLDNTRNKPPFSKS